MEHVKSESDDRVVNNAVRHKYRVLSDAEKEMMLAVKDKGAEFIALLDSLPKPTVSCGIEAVQTPYTPREIHLAIERSEEAVMWAVKHITA